MKQREAMRSLYYQGGMRDLKSIVPAYAAMEREGKVARKSNVGGISPEEYARRLFQEGIRPERGRPGWLLR